ncbi:hypothetical protein X797_009877 [Metarhizium robertsii]|uniref:Uncharacterized protein n=1 Tax=Metarhizium robertsii TaxID=568076 RepID=A0A0A1UQ12_9HYPO|nr:hypothetical protein X797_009877 [Metarhizium robertsii]
MHAFTWMHKATTTNMMKPVVCDRYHVSRLFSTSVFSSSAHLNATHLQPDTTPPHRADHPGTHPARPPVLQQRVARKVPDSSAHLGTNNTTVGTIRSRIAETTA